LFIVFQELFCSLPIAAVIEDQGKPSAFMITNP
jgi:hypothetical protein